MQGFAGNCRFCRFMSFAHSQNCDVEAGQIMMRVLRGKHQIYVKKTCALTKFVISRYCYDTTACTAKHTSIIIIR